MLTENTSFWEWQKKFSTEASCLKHLMKLRWPEGFVCPHCHHNHGYFNGTRKYFECAGCHKRTSATSGTLFHGSRLPLQKSFWAIFYTSIDKGGISALRLSKLLEVNWKTVFSMLRKITKAMGNQDSTYSLSGVVELDDAFVEGKKTGKRGRGMTVVMILLHFNQWQMPSLDPNNRFFIYIRMVAAEVRAADPGACGV